MKRRIAVVEDDESIAALLRSLLAMEGFEVTVVPDGTRALRILAGGGFDAAVLDVMLPGKDGISVLQEVRRNPPTSTLPVVMLSAKTDDRTTWEGWRAGCDLYVTKPFDPEQLVRAIKGMVA